MVTWAVTPEEEKLIAEAIRRFAKYANEETETERNKMNAQMKTPAQPTKSDDLKLVIKLMKMTTSQNDSEALAALRQANKRLLAAGWDWEALLTAKVTIVADPFGSIEAPTASPQSYSKPQAPQRPAPAAPSYQPPPQASYSPNKPSQKAYQRAKLQAAYNAPAAAQAQAAAQYSYKPSTTPKQPSPKVGSKTPNQQDDNCWCCGQRVEAWKGAAFVPGHYNSSHHSQKETICEPCNQSAALSVPLKRAKRKGQTLTDLGL